MKEAKNKRILCIPDTHFPYQHPNFFIDIARHIRYFKPTHIVHMGDIVDFHAISRHDPDPDGPDIKVELSLTKKELKKFISIIPTNIPFKLCIGNHDNRIEKRASNNGIPQVFLKSFRELLELPKHWDIGFEHFVDGIAFTHGKSNLRGKTAISYGCNVVQGHYHSMLDISYHQTPTKLIWSVFSGSAADDTSLAMRYAHNSINKGVYGFVLIEDGIPKIEPGTHI